MITASTITVSVLAMGIMRTIVGGVLSMLVTIVTAAGGSPAPTATASFAAGSSPFDSARSQYSATNVVTAVVSMRVLTYAGLRYPMVELSSRAWIAT